MKLKPVADRIIVKRNDAVKVTEGGLLLPDESVNKPMDGVVVAVGEGHLVDSGEIIPLQFKVGDIVLFSKNSGTPIFIDGEEHLVFTEREILAIVKERI